MAQVSVIIAAWQAGHTLAHTLESVRRSVGGQAAEIIVADDGSTDDTAVVAAAHGARVLSLPHAGRAAALNAALVTAQGEVIFFTDADCVVPTGWIPDTLAALGNNAGVGGNLWPANLSTVELAKVLRYVEEFENDFVLAGHYDGVCLNGNNMAIRKSALDAVGGFDPAFVHGADADLTRRLLAAGYRLSRVTRLRTFHLKVDRLGGFLRTMWRRGSTVRFGMKEGTETPATLARALLLSPWKWLARDLARVPRLAVFGDAVRWQRAWLAPLVNLLGSLTTAVGRIHFYRRFRREGL